jgi:hypothetical protein
MQKKDVMIKSGTIEEMSFTVHKNKMKVTVTARKRPY